MPCKKEHVIFSSIAGALFVAYVNIDKRGLDFWKSLGCGALGGAIGGYIPDYLDPPTSPFHRSSAHGIVPLCAAPVVVFTSKNPLIQGLSVGYATHLLQDSVTPMGLPI